MQKPVRLRRIEIGDDRFEMHRIIAPCFLRGKAPHFRNSRQSWERIASGIRPDITRRRASAARQKQADENNTVAKELGQLLPLSATPIDPTLRIEELPRLTSKGHSLFNCNRVIRLRARRMNQRAG